MYFYTVIETQVANGSVAVVPPTVYTDLNQAEAALYTVLAAAAVSSVEYHSGVILRSDGIVIEGKVFDRRVAASVEE